MTVNPDTVINVYAPHDYDFWIKSAPWSRHVAVLLALGEFPTNTDADSTPITQPVELAERYKKYMSYLCGAISNGMQEPFQPATILEWAEANNLSTFPKELKKKIFFYQKLKRNLEREFLDGKEQKSLMLMLGGIIRTVYQKDVKLRERESLTTAIKNDLLLAGIDMDRGTILKWLRKVDPMLTKCLQENSTPE